MQPNNPFSEPTLGIDYLNQIAPPEKPAGFDKKSKIIVIAMVIVGILGLSFIFFASQGTREQASPMTLIVKLQRLNKLSTKYNTKLRENEIQNINSSLIAVLLTANKSIGDISGIDLKKQEKEIQTKIDSEKIEKRLDDAYLNANLDESYAHAINTEIADILLTMKKLNENSGEKMRQYIKKTAGDLVSIRKQLTSLINKSNAN